MSTKGDRQLLLTRDEIAYCVDGEGMPLKLRIAPQVRSLGLGIFLPFAFLFAGVGWSYLTGGSPFLNPAAAWIWTTCTVAASLIAALGFRWCSQRNQAIEAVKETGYRRWVAKGGNT